jgi:hypothetical protein
MALLSQASDLITRQTVWVSTNVAKGKDQANSHTRDNFTVDGLSAADLAGMSAHAFRNDVRAMQWG